MQLRIILTANQVIRLLIGGHVIGIILLVDILVIRNVAMRFIILMIQIILLGHVSYGLLICNVSMK